MIQHNQSINNMTVKVLIGLEEAKAFAASKIAERLDIDQYSVFVDIDHKVQSVDLQDPNIARSNKINLIKFARCVAAEVLTMNGLRKVGADGSWLETGKNIGLAEAKAFVEKYFNIQ